MADILKHNYAFLAWNDAGESIAIRLNGVTADQMDQLGDAFKKIFGLDHYRADIIALPN